MELLHRRYSQLGRIDLFGRSPWHQEATCRGHLADCAEVVDAAVIEYVLSTAPTVASHGESAQ